MSFKQNYCWGCGYESNIQRAHLHAHCKGGNEKCDNFDDFLRRGLLCV